MENMIFDCLIKTPEEVYFHAKLEFSQRQESENLVMYKNEVVIPDRIIADYLGISTATMSRFRAKVRYLVQERSDHEPNLYQ